MEEAKDVTAMISGQYEFNTVRMLRCVCGERFPLRSRRVLFIGMGPSNYTCCPVCDAKLYFEVSVRVYQIQPG